MLMLRTARPVVGLMPTSSFNMVKGNLACTRAFTTVMRNQRPTITNNFAGIKQLRTFSTSRGGQTSVITRRSDTSGYMWAGAGALALLGLGYIAQDNTRAAQTGEPTVVNGQVVAQWPAYVQSRLRKTYTYVLGGIGLTAVSAVYVFRSSLGMRLATMNPLVVAGMTMVGTIGCMITAQAAESDTIKHVAWVGFNGFIGMSLFPLAAVAGPILTQAALATAGVIGAISLVAMTAPDEAHLSMRGPLAVGLGVVFAASIGQLFLPAMPLLYNVSLYGGMLVFGGFTFYDTQKIITRAKTRQDFHPLNESISLYLDIVNIFTRMVQIFMNQGNNRRR
eukprot:Clim_evm9s20 gene=Clim_evmTU9s20